MGEVFITVATAGTTKATSIAGRSAELVKVTRWGRPGLKAGDWVMKGGKTPLNYRLSGKFQNGYGNKFASFESGTTFEVPAGSLYRARGLFDKNPFDGRIKSLAPRQRRYIPEGQGLMSFGEAGLFTGFRALNAIK